jgi:hypothetical protein
MYCAANTTPTVPNSSPVNAIAPWMMATIMRLSSSISKHLTCDSYVNPVTRVLSKHCASIM